MKAGRLRDKVTFQQATTANNSLGEPIKTWADIATVWGRVEPMAGKERFTAMQTRADVDYTIQCRYESALSGLGPDDRATWDGNTFDIHTVIARGQRRTELEILAKEHL